MAQQIKKKFLSDEVINYFDDQIQSVSGEVSSEQSRAESAEQALDAKIEQEKIDRASEDASTLASSNSYTDSKVLEEKELRESGDSALDSRITTLESQVGEDLQQAISDLEASDTELQSQIDTEKGRIDAILLASEADKDSFAEIVQLINSVDTENDQAFASYVLSNDAAVEAVEGRLDVVEPKVSTLESEMDQAQSDISSLQSEDLTFVKVDGSRNLTGVLKPATSGTALGSGANHFGNVFGRDYVHFNSSGQNTGALASNHAAPNGPETNMTGFVATGNSNGAIFFTGTNLGGVTKPLHIETGKSTSGNTGDIKLRTGTTSGVRGTVSVEAKQVSLNSIKIIGLAAGEGQYDAVNKGQLDSAISSEASARESADLALDGRITSLEGQVGEDLQQAISDLEAGIAAEALARSNADTALQGEIDVLKTFGLDQIVHVAKNGLDSNSGKQHSPFLTITAALNAITDASPTKRYALKVAPGNYSEAISLKANVFIVGEGQKESVRVTGAVSMHSSFSGTGDHRSGFSNVTLLSAADFNWSTVTSAAGKLYFNETVFGSTVDMYGHNNAIAQAQFNSCILFGHLTISGINVGVFTNNVSFSNITLNQHPNGGMATILAATGGYCNTLTQNAATNDFNRRSASFLRNFNSEKLVLNGPSVYADADLVSQGKQEPDILNNANLVAFNPRINHDLTTGMIVPKATNSHNMGDWGKQWTWNFGYVHASTGTDLYLISYPESYGPDSSGKSIGIYTDGAGLQENVDGGSVEIATATTSGTGVRGIVKLDGRIIDVSSKQVKNLADGTDSSDAVNKSQLDSALSGVQSQIDTEKERVDAILLASEADKDSFVEIVSLINSVDTENDAAFAGYALLNNARVDALEAKGYSKGSVVIGAELGFIDLDKVYSVLLSVSVGRLAIHEGEDYTTSVVDGKTRLTWIGSLVNPGGAEAIETGDKVFYSGAF